MQTIKHKDGYKNAHWLLDEVERLYADLSCEYEPVATLFDDAYDDSLQGVYDLFIDNCDTLLKPCKFESKQVDEVQLPQMLDNAVIVCYSGGKDSLAVVRHYQQLGYDVYAYHIKGLNKTYTDEWKIAVEASKQYGFKLVLDEVGYRGNHMWVEHPMKNMIMANMALSWGIANRITTKIAVGCFQTAYVDLSSFAVCGGDSIEMWQEYDEIVQRFLPNFQIEIPLDDGHAAYRIIEKEPNMLKYVISCMTPNRFRKLFRERTIRNYTVDLLPNRCGCCWKCALEYIWFADVDVLEYNEKYYIHCLEVLAHTLAQEGNEIYDLYDVWEYYLFDHPMSDSKAKEILPYAVISTGKIKIIK